MSTKQRTIPPLMTHAERRKLIMQPLNIQTYGHTYGWGGVSLKEDEEDMRYWGRIQRQEEQEARDDTRGHRWRRRTKKETE